MEEKKSKGKFWINFILVILIIFLLIFTLWLFDHNSYKEWKIKDSQTQLENLEKQAEGVKSKNDSLIYFNTSLGKVRVRKTDTINILERKIDTLVLKLNNEKATTGIKTNDLVELKITIEELRKQELTLFNAFNEQLTRRGDTSELTHLLTSIKQVDRKISEARGNIHELLQRAVKLEILHFRAYNANGEERYLTAKVRKIVVDCYVLCLFKDIPIFLIFKDPNGNILPFETRSNLVKLAQKHVFPSISDTLRKNGNYSKTISVKNFNTSGDYEVIIIDENDSILASKTIKLK
jgi:hypothetical protein